MGRFFTHGSLSSLTTHSLLTVAVEPGECDELPHVAALGELVGEGADLVRVRVRVRVGEGADLVRVRVRVRVRVGEGADLRDESKGVTQGGEAGGQAGVVKQGCGAAV